MPRSRSRSPARRDVRRSRSRERERDRDKERDRKYKRHRSRSGSPRKRKRSRSRHRSPARDYNASTSAKAASVSNTSEKIDLNGTAPNMDEDDDEIDMKKLMGFSDFNTTKGKHVQGNDIYVANITQKRRYRQYMNRRGGFNRPLDPIA